MTLEKEGSPMSDVIASSSAEAGRDEHRVWVEPCRRRVRARWAGRVVADSKRVLYLFETGHLPVYYFPMDDLDRSVLTPSDHTTHCPYKGDASYWSLAVGDRTAADAVWGYRSPVSSCPDIAGYVALYWDHVDAWFEEDDEVFVHARDPYHRVDVLASSRHVQVVVGGVVVADSTRPRLLFETSLPVRYYLPKLDVRLDLLVASASVSRCPYKGLASYWTVDTGEHRLEDAVWAYEAPIPECPKIENLVCFFDERVEAVLVDGVEQPRPTTPWS
jgi:uncharacterized protein (DUF427 family)